jgi:hypothetical protein
MTSGVTVHGSLPDGVRLLGRIDAEVSQAFTRVRKEALTAYKNAAPGRIAGGVKVRRDAKYGQRLVVTVGKKPLGGKNGGRDVGTQAAAYWTNFGTRARIQMKRPVKLPNGRIVTEVKGQRAQGWIAEARRQADANAHVLIDQHLDHDITAILGGTA